MKKVTLLMVLVFLLMSVVPVNVFAVDEANNTASNAANTLAAINRLKGFGMIPDSTMKSGETVTRAQLAKMLVVALGYRDAASAATGTAKFTDVAGDHWASGYINLASGLGIIKGLGNDKFSPDGEVTYSQALTMLVRTLGYKDEFLPGSWPMNYLDKAKELDLNRGLSSITVNGALTNGNVAVLLSNMLDTPLKNSSVNMDSQTLSTALLAKKLNVTRIGSGSFIVVKTPSELDSLKPNRILLSDGKEYECCSAITADDYLGMEIKAWANEGGQIAVMEVQTSSACIYRGSVEEKDNKLYLSGLNKSYELDSGFLGYINKLNYSNEIWKAFDYGPATGLVILTPDGSKILRAHLSLSKLPAPPTPAAITATTTESDPDPTPPGDPSTAAIPFVTMSSGMMGFQMTQVFCSTSGASVYYTLDGSTPTTSSSIVTSGASFSVSEAIMAEKPLKMKATASGMNDSPIATYFFSEAPTMCWLMKEGQNNRTITPGGTPSIETYEGAKYSVTAITISNTATSTYTISGSGITVSGNGKTALPEYTVVQDDFTSGLTITIRVHEDGKVDWVDVNQVTLMH